MKKFLIEFFIYYLLVINIIIIHKDTRVSSPANPLNNSYHIGKNSNFTDVVLEVRLPYLLLSPIAKEMELEVIKAISISPLPNYYVDHQKNEQKMRYDRYNFLPLISLFLLIIFLFYLFFRILFFKLIPKESQYATTFVVVITLSIVFILNHQLIEFDAGNGISIWEYILEYYKQL